MSAVKARLMTGRGALMATAAVTVLAAVAGSAHAGTPIDTNQPFYNQSDVGTTVNPDFEGGTLRDNVNGATDNHAYNVGNVPTNTLDAFGNTTTFTQTFSGSGPLTVTDSVGGGNVVFTGTSILGGAVTINNGATMSWGDGSGGAFLIGPGNAMVDNGSLVMNFGGVAGVVGEIPISGTGSVTIHTGVFDQLGASTYTGTTTVDPGGVLQLGSSGSSVGTLAGDLVDNGSVQFQYGGAGPVNAPGTISGSGSAEVESGTLVAASGLNVVGGTVTVDSGATLQWGNGGVGAFGGLGGIADNGTFAVDLGGGNVEASLVVSGSGVLHVASGTLGLSGVNTYTGVTTVDAGSTLELFGAGSVSNSSNMTVNGTFDISGSSGTSITTLDGSGQVSLGAQTLTLTAANGTFAGVLADGGLAGGTGGGLTIAGGTETLTGTNTYTGATTIDLGATLILGNGGSTGTVAGNVVDNGLLQFSYTGAVTAPGNISGGGSAEVVSGTLVAASGLNVVGGTVAIDSGATLQWGNGGVGAFGGLGGIVDNGAFVIDLGGGNVTSSIAVSGTGDLHVASGLLGLTATNTYTGVTTIDGGAVLELTGGGSVSNSSNVVVNGTLDISGEPAGTSITTLSGTGGVSLGAQTLTLTSASGTFAGNLADGGVAGGTGGGLTIAGGTETLTGTNTYTGVTTINSGATLVLGDGGLTGTVAGNVTDNGLMQFNYGGPVTINNNIGGSGSAEVVAGTLVIGSGLSVIGGTVAVDSGATLQWGNGGVGAFGGIGGIVDNGTFAIDFGGGNVETSIVVSGTGDLHVASGTLGLSGANTYAGVTTIDGGGLLELFAGGSIGNSSNVVDNGTLDISGEPAGTSITTLGGAGGVSLGAQTLTLTNASGTFGGVLADGGIGGGTGGGLTIAGGTETLTGTNTYTGVTTINSGATLQLGAGGSTGTVAGDISDNGNLKFVYGGPVTINNNIGGSGSAEVVSGTLVVASGLNVIGGTVSIDNGATLQWGNGGSAAFGGAGGIVDNGAFAIDFGGGNVETSIVVSGTGDLHVASGTFGLSGVNTYTGVTTIDGGGLLELFAGGSISNSSDVIVNGTLDISGEPAGTSITTLAGTGGVSLGGQTLTLTNASGTFGGVLADGGIGGGTHGGLTIGGGVETLTGVNTFTGLTTVDTGATLKLAGVGSIATSDPLVNGTFDISGSSGGVDITSLSGHGQVLLGANTLTLTAANDLFSGVISGTGGLTIAAGIEALSGVNTFTGTTLIDPGATLQLGDGAGTMGLLTGPIADNGHLVFDGGAGSDAIFATPISGAGDMTLVAGTLGLTGTNTYAGPTTVDLGATLQLGAGGATGSVTGAVIDNGLVQFNYGGAPVVASNTFTGAGAAEVVAGTVVITGASAVGGNVTIDHGATMQWGNGSVAAFLIGGTGVVDNGALVMDFGGGGVGTSSVISGSGDVTLQTGSFNTAGVNTYTGATTIDSGAIFLVSAGGSIATSSNVVDNGFFDISGETTGTSIKSLSGSGEVSVGSQTLTLTNASGTFSGVIQNAGFFAGTGGGLTIAGGTETLTGTNIYTGATTIDVGATLALGNGGPTGSVAGAIVDNGLVQFVYGGGPVVSGNTFTGTGAAEVVSGTVVITGASTINGNVTIDSGATMQWGDAGPTPGFLIGGTGVVDNGHLVMDFGGGGVGTSSVISGSGDVTLQTGSFNTAGVNTYTGATTIDSGAIFLVSGGGSIATSSNVVDNGFFDISGETTGTSIKSLGGSGEVSVGSQTLTLTNASGTFSGVIQNAGFFAGTGGGLTIAGGTETLTGTNTFTGLATIDAGATLQLGAGGTTGSVAGPILDNGSLLFDYGGPVTMANPVGGTGSAELLSGTLVVTGPGLVGGDVTIDHGATMQWGDGAVGFLLGGSGVVDNGALVMDFGANGLALTSAISGAGTVTLASGAFESSAVNTYAGVTTIDAGAVFRLSGAGSISNSANVVDNGFFDISDTTAGTSISDLGGGGVVFLGSHTLTLTDASGAFAGVMADGGHGGGAGGGLTIGAGSLTLTGANVFTGLTTIDAGAALQLGAGGTTGSLAGNILDSGTLVIDRSNLIVFGQTISGAGAIDQVGGGTTIFDAVNPFNGLTTVSGGTLVVGDAAHPGAVLGGDVLVGSGGRLEGHGTVGGSVTNNGVVAPGGTIGTLTVGSFTQGPGGTLAIEVSPPVASQLNSVGAASLNGKLALTFDPGVYTNHIYDILNGHPVTGTFASVTASGSPGPGITFGVLYAPTQVDLVTEFTSNAQVYGAVSAATIDRAQNFATLVEDRFGDAGCANGSPDKAGCGGYGAWAFAIGSWERQDADGGAFGFRNTGAGVVAGIDRSTENGSLVGASFGYAHNDLDMGSAASRASGPSYFGAIYGRLVDGGLWFDSQVFYMHSDWSVSRVMSGVGAATSSPGADSEGFLLQASLPIGDTGFRPYARFTYVLSNRGGVQENGVGPLGFQIDSATHSAAVGELGMRYEAVFGTPGGMQVRPSLQLGVQGNAGDRDQVVTGSLDGLPGSGFAETAPRFWHVAGVADGAVKVRVNQSLELFGDVQGRFSGNQTDAVASIGGVIRF